MNVVSLTGGLGNQMFQYAFGCALGDDTAYDVSWFDLCARQHVSTIRHYELDKFKVNPNLLSGEETKRLKREDWLSRIGLCRSLREVREMPENRYDSKLLKLKNSKIFGYFQVAAYCELSRARLLREFTLRDEPTADAYVEMLKRVRNENSVSVHIRRGDYLQLQTVHPVCGVDYYQRATAWMRETIGPCSFFVFSDDLGWCRENLPFPDATTFVDLSALGRPELDMMLMRACRHNVIANSSFSWWGAWLNENPQKRVVAPQRWFGEADTDIVPEEWVRL